MFKHLLWILPFLVLQIVIKPYCCSFECCFYINQAPTSIYYYYYYYYIDALLIVFILFFKQLKETFEF